MVRKGGGCGLLCGVRAAEIHSVRNSTGISKKGCSISFLPMLCPRQVKLIRISTGYRKWLGIFG
jgi:hypothetical protein